MHRFPFRILVSTITSFWLLAGCSPSLLVDGARCSIDGDCASGECVAIDGVQTCSAPCLIGDTCAAGPSGARACREDGYCHAPCSFDGARDGQVCRSGAVLECGSLDAASACEDCGCEVFGGGVCVEGSGCVQPGPEGTACTDDRFCTSGLCLPSSSTCIAPIATGESCEDDRFCASGVCGVSSHLCVEPAAMGEACSADAECQSANCSNDGDATRAGVCNQPLGEECDPAHCSVCVGADVTFGFHGYCMRVYCNPSTAGCGGPIGAGREFDCLRSVADDYRCYETCPTNFDDALGYHCLDTNTCHYQSGTCS